MYKVTVQKVNIVEKTVKEWQKLRESAVGEPEYGYVQTKNMVDEETTIFYQEVDSINLVSIIDAVNKVPAVTKKESK